MCVVCGKGQYCLHHLADLDLKGPFMCSYDDAHALCVCVFVGWWVACLCIIPLVEFGFKHKSENSHRHSLQYAWPTLAAYSVLKTTHEVTLTVSLWKISAFKSMFVCVCVWL